MSQRQGFDETILGERLYKGFGLEDHHRLHVALSGGLDSTVLLHALTRLEGVAVDRITALHVNHGLHKESGAWEKSSKKICDSLGVRFRATKLKCPERIPRGLEAWAREARYKWFEQLMSENSVLLTAHHLNDQAETVLVNLLRGSGPAGMQGVRKQRNLGQGVVWRPLLDIPRSSLLSYAIETGLEWVNDPGNDDSRFSRNHLRHDLIPLLETKWPAVVRVLGRTAQVSSETMSLLDEVAASDLIEAGGSSKDACYKISRRYLCQLSKPRCMNLLRYWFRSRGFEMPSNARIQKVFEEMIVEIPTSTAVIGWSGSEIRCYRDWLYLSAPIREKNITTTLWDGISPIDVGSDRLFPVPSVGTGIKLDAWSRGPLSIRGRQAGDRVMLPGRCCHHKLKNILQENAIPPWQRDQVPLLCIDNDLAAVVGLFYCDPFAAREGEPGMTVEIRNQRK